MQKCLTLENKTNRNVSDEAWGSQEAILVALQESWTFTWKFSAFCDVVGHRIEHLSALRLVTM